MQVINLFIAEMSMHSDDYSYTTPNFFSNAPHRNQNQLWVDSQITGKFVSPQLSFSKEKRFKWASIYWPEDSDRLHAVNKKRKSEVYEIAQKISKIIDEEEKNQIRIKQIKRSLSIGKSSTGTAKKQFAGVLSTKKPFKLSRENEQIVLRLSPREPRKQSTLRDRHGNRCQLYQDPQAERTQEDALNLGSSTGFRTSRRIKLDLPHNYNPGPGSYEIKRYLAQLQLRSRRLPQRPNHQSESHS